MLKLNWRAANIMVKNSLLSMPTFLSRLKEKRNTRINKRSNLKRLANYAESAPIIRIWIRINQSLTLLAIVIAAYGLNTTINKNKMDQVKADEDRIAKAWDLITKASGKSSNYGQVAALETLNSEHVSLDHIDLHNTFLAGVKLHGAKLRYANLKGATLAYADLSGAELRSTDLRNTNLVRANLAGADLVGASLDDANLSDATVDLAVLFSSIKDTNFSAVKFVYEDSNGDISWSYADSIGEGDEKMFQNILYSACIDPKHPPTMLKYIPLKSPNRPCRVIPDFVSTVNEYK